MATYKNVLEYTIDGPITLQFYSRVIILTKTTYYLFTVTMVADGIKGRTLFSSLEYLDLTTCIEDGLAVQKQLTPQIIEILLYSDGEIKPKELNVILEYKYLEAVTRREDARRAGSLVDSKIFRRGHTKGRIDRGDRKYSNLQKSAGKRWAVIRKRTNFLIVLPSEDEQFF